VIIGDGPQREGLEWLVESERTLGVTFTGQVSHDEVASQFAKSDIYLNSSTLDGLPLSLLEALSAGLPVVSTKVGEIPAIIQERVNGLLVENADPIVLADRIIELVEKPALVEKLSANSRQTSYCPV
jgi:phenylacetate-CoA ligase